MASVLSAPPDPAARKAGLLLILTAAMTVVAVVGRVAADADHPTLTESLAAIAANKGLYGIGGAARFISGITLVAGGWFLLRTWIIRQRLGTPLVPILFIAAGLSTAISGAGAVVLAAVPVAPDSPGAINGGTFLETVAMLRELTGKIGFTLAGLALIVAARYQWKVGGTLRRIAPVTAIIGIALQFIWIDAVIMLHMVSGAAFLIWLLVIGSMLFTGRVERHFVALSGAERTE